MSTKKKFNYNILSCIFIYIWAAAFFISSLSIENKQSRIFPTVMCACAVLLATLFLIACFRGKDQKEGEEPADFTGTARAAIFGVILIGYILANYLAGYYIATILFLPLGMLYLGQRNWKAIIPVSIGVPLLIYLVFDMVLGMVMPTGILFM